MMFSLALITQYFYWIAFLCLASGTIYFLMERSSLLEEYRSTATAAAIVCFVAACNYWVMQDMVGRDGSIESILNFPTEFRYLDWLITTPLILTKFPSLLGFDEERRPMLVTLIFADLVMIITGFAGEQAINRAGGAFSPLGVGMFIASASAFLFIVYLLYTVVTTAARGKLQPIQDGLRKLKLFIAIGWTIYPIGYLVSMFGIGPEGQVLRELIYNIADVINKVGFGLVAVFAVRQVSRDQSIRKAIADL
ncbi:MAG: bacteriorhodopsin [Acidobacteriota bacterium]